MPLQRAEQFFRKGLACLHEDRPQEAARHFLTAIQLEREQGVRTPQMRYLSHYGLALTLAHGAGPDARLASETAVEREPENPDLWWNAARVRLAAGSPQAALQAVARGLALDPDHGGLRALLRRLERRSRPAVRFLTRDHPVNRVLGRLRASLRA